MQFILTLLISVRGRGLLKDGSDASFFGDRGEAGLTDTQAQPGGRAWTCARPQVWLGGVGSML